MTITKSHKTTNAEISVEESLWYFGMRFVSFDSDFLEGRNTYHESMYISLQYNKVLTVVINGLQHCAAK